MEPKLCVTLGRCLFSDRIAVLKLDRELHEKVKILWIRWAAVARATQIRVARVRAPALQGVSGQKCRHIEGHAHDLSKEDY